MMKSRLATLLCLATMLALTVVPAYAGDLVVRNWRIYNIKPDSSAYWDINKAMSLDGGGLQFPIQQFESTASGSFAVYLLANYNVELAGKTICARGLSWSPGVYETRSTVHPGAYVRFWFQDVAAGPYDSNDYWWSTVSLDLNGAGSGDLVASLSDRALWTNQSGKPATDRTEDWLQWQGDIVHMSPYDGFTRAMKNVKQFGLSFGSSGSYASGVALDGGPGVFAVKSFTAE
jgi:hypothetical protein